jgi:hypothetical protein
VLRHVQLVLALHPPPMLREGALHRRTLVAARAVDVGLHHFGDPVDFA